MNECWVMKEKEYEVGVNKPESSWIGVTNICFADSNDEYAQVIGWYKTTFGGTEHIFPSLRDALRSYDRHIIESKDRNQISATELNFPEEYLK